MVSADFINPQKKKEKHSSYITYLGQVSIVAGQAQIQLAGIVVGQNPGKDRILDQIVIGPSYTTQTKKYKQNNKTFPHQKPFS